MSPCLISPKDASKSVDLVCWYFFLYSADSSFSDNRHWFGFFDIIVIIIIGYYNQCSLRHLFLPCTGVYCWSLSFKLHSRLSTASPLATHTPTIDGFKISSPQFILPNYLVLSSTHTLWGGLRWSRDQLLCPTKNQLDCPPRLRSLKQ